MVTEVQSKEIQCPNCEARFSRPLQAATATCTKCGACVTLVDEVLDRPLVFRGEVVTRGRILVGPEGQVKANLSATEVVIDGVVEGNVTAVEKLRLGNHAKLRGNVVAGALIVSEGASLYGRLEIGCQKR